MSPSELEAVRRTALNAVNTLKVAGYAGTGEQLRGAVEMLVEELRSREELPAPEVKTISFETLEKVEAHGIALGRQLEREDIANATQRKNAAVR